VSRATRVRPGRTIAGSVLLLAGAIAAAGSPRSATASTSRIALERVEPAGGVPRFATFELTARIDTAASVPLWPYDAAPPHGVPTGLGVSVVGEFVDPDGREFAQPGFYYEGFEQDVRQGRDWRYPTGEVSWKVRFSPNRVGTWKYRLAMEDRRGREATAWQTLTVTPSTSRGFLRVSRADRRYFELEDGTFFTGLGFQVPEHFTNPVSIGAPFYRTLGQNGITLGRLWVSSLFGSAWTPWVGGRNRYSGYLPVAGTVPFAAPGEPATFAMRLDYEPSGDTGWFDACRLQWADDATAVKPATAYTVSATYAAREISGPRSSRAPGFGFVVKAGGMFPACFEPGTSRVVTGYGGASDRPVTVTGTWRSGQRAFMPKLHVALENVTSGAAYVRSISVRESRPDGSPGPEILERASLQVDRYVPQSRALALDTIVDLASKNGVYLKLVVMDKGDEMYQKLADDGGWVRGEDNRDGVYGTGRVVNRTRWLQQAWWRYLQARWGHSPAIHSWELVNEGDPASVRHYEAADEFGKYMHFGVFGKAPAAGFDHPNDHLVTTSFWHSFPAEAFWGNPKYPHVDYADIHAYVSTSFAPSAERARMAADAAYYHTWHSQAVAAAKIGKPVVRGEAGLDVPGRQDERVLGLDRDPDGIWLHNFLWSGLDSGGLYEVYWWRSHVWGPQGDHRGHYRRIADFLADLDLNKGGYADWSGTVSTPALRVVGQKNPARGRLHLWVQNVQHTWKRVADRQPIDPVSGTVRVPGFTPDAVFGVTWWDTYEATPAVRRRVVRADGGGTVTLAIEGLRTDVALKLEPECANTQTDGKERTQPCGA
jgi:hypothetical protein